MMPGFRGKSIAELDEKIKRMLINKLNDEGKKQTKKASKSWIDPLDARKLLKAMDNSVRTVILSKGEFFIKHKPKRDAIFIYPTRGFVPCAWVTRSSLTKIVTEDEQGV